MRSDNPGDQFPNGDDLLLLALMLLDDEEEDDEELDKEWNDDLDDEDHE